MPIFSALADAGCGRDDTGNACAKVVARAASGNHVASICWNDLALFII